MEQVKIGRWEIRNDLLHELLTYGDNSPHLLGLSANWNVGHGFPVVKGILTWLVMRALRIERLPWMADWPFSFVPADVKLMPALKYLIDTPQMVDDACEEIRLIHDHTQRWFAERDCSKVRLGRGYQNDESLSRSNGEYANTLLRQAAAAAHLGVDHIDVPHDVLTSWGPTCEYPPCVAGVEMDIPVIDIFCGAATIAPRKRAIGPNAVEPEEWLVINRRWDGLKALPVDAIRALYGHQVQPVSPKEAQKVLDEPIPVVRRTVLHNLGSEQQPRARQSFHSRWRRGLKVIFTPIQ